MHADIKEYQNPLEKEAAAGVFWLLLDLEINGATREHFFRIARKFTSSGGVEANSRLSFVFDPAYQQLVIHKIVLHRGDGILNQLKPEGIRVIQQEADLGRLIYNGAKTALLFLEDVRVGDWVEYAYTIRGRSPVEAGHFYDSLQLRYPFPIQEEHYRLLWPRTSQPLSAQLSGPGTANRKDTNGYYEYAWHWENRRGQEIEDFLPTQTLPLAMVHFSDYRNWADVANWAVKSFQPERVTEELYQKIIRIRDENATDEQRILKALEFVQDDIRYLGIENGINSHQPTDPSVVFSRRYGDCKDKALLFCTILRFFEGVDASPVLVSTRFKRLTQSFMATPLIFDHAIVRVSFQGKTNYLDVTRSHQRGRLDRRFVDFYGAGLLLDERSPGLVQIPPTNSGLPKTRIEEEFEIATNGVTTLVVTSTFEGRDADLIRQGRATTGLESIDKTTLADYNRFYPGVASFSPTETQEDEPSGVIRVIRRYFIPNIWRRSAQTNLITCEFVTRGMLERLFVPTKKERKLPLAIPFPENCIHTLRIKAREPWLVPPREKKIQTKGFLFHNRVTHTNNDIEVTCQMVTLNPAILAADMPEYWAALDEIPRFLGLIITKPVSGIGRNDSPNWPLWIAEICYCIVLLTAAGLTYRHQAGPAPELGPPPNPELQGLRGWLAVLGLMLVIAPFARLYPLVKSHAVFSSWNWRLITDPATNGYDPLLAPILLFEHFSQLTLLIFCILLLALFFQKRRIFPTLLIVYLSLQFAIAALDQGLVRSRNLQPPTSSPRRQPPSVVGQTLVPLVVWALYVRRSRRVKATFLR